MIEQLIRTIAPTWAYHRAKARFLASVVDSAYSGASFTSRKMHGWLPARGSADRDYGQGEQDILVARCRDAYRNQPLARAALERLKHGVIGVGLRLQAKPDRQALGLTDEESAQIEQQIEREFDHWGRSCDIEKTLTFQQIQSLCVVSWLVSGDVFLNTPFREGRECDYGLRLQVIEADRVSNPNYTFDTQYLRRGVGLDKFGAPLVYWIQTQHPGDVQPVEFKWERFEAFGQETGRRRILHIFDKERPGQTRGVPFLSPILETLRQLEKYSDAELTAAVVSSLLTVFVKTENGIGLPTMTASTNEPAKADEISLSPGAVINLLPNESIETMDPHRPNQAFEPFMMAIFKQIGAALSLPLEFLMLHFTSSYSASRAALLQAWKLIAYQRQIIERMLCQPIYELWFDEFVAREKINAPGYWEDSLLRAAWTKASWVGPTLGSIDDTKEVAAARDRIELGISTIQHEAEKLLGLDWLDIHRQRTIEHRERAAAGLESPVLGSSGASSQMIANAEPPREVIEEIMQEQNSALRK